MLHLQITRVQIRATGGCARPSGQIRLVEQCTVSVETLTPTKRLCDCNFVRPNTLTRKEVVWISTRNKHSVKMHIETRSTVFWIRKPTNEASVRNRNQTAPNLAAPQKQQFETSASEPRCVLCAVARRVFSILKRKESDATLFVDVQISPAQSHNVGRAQTLSEHHEQQNQCAQVGANKRNALRNVVQIGGRQRAAMRPSRRGSKQLL